MRGHQDAFIFGLLIICQGIICHGAVGSASDLLVAPLVKAIFNFGDSTTDTGTNTYLPNPAFLANFTPYGETYFKYPTGRFSNGRLIIDLIAAVLQIPFLQPYLQPNVTYYENGVSFASAGSGFLNTTNTGKVVNMPDQVEQFRKVKASLLARKGTLATQFLLFRSLFIISSGSNDIFYNYHPNQTTPEAFTDNLIQHLERTVTALVKEGASKLVIASLTPIGCVPSQVSADGTCNDSLNRVAQLYNSKLSDFQKRFSANLLGPMVIVANFYDTLEGFIKKGNAIGFTQGSTACCGGGPFRGRIGNQCGTKDSAGNDLYTKCSDDDLNSYVFWDYFHPTDRAYEYLAIFFLFGNTTFIQPCNITTLAAL